MDVYSPLSFVLTVLFIVFDICYVTARYRLSDTDIHLEKNIITRVTDSMCGQEMHLSHISRNRILLLYDGASIRDQCVIHITRRDRTSGTCIEVYDMIKQDASFDCWNALRFSFGDDLFENTTKYFRCPENHQNICDLHPTAHVEFNRSGILNKNVKFQIKVSLSNRLRKRSSSDSWSSWDDDSWSLDDWTSWSSWSSWDDWSSWSSWSSDYEKEQEEKRKESSRTGIIILCTLVAVVGVISYMLCKCRETSEELNSGGSRESIASQQDSRPVASLPERRTYTSHGNSEHLIVTSTNNAGVRPGHSTEYIGMYAVQPPAETSDTDDNVGTRSPLMHQAPVLERPENTLPDTPPPSYTAPPPSYASLFPND